MNPLELLALDIPGMMVVGAFAIIVLWMIADVHIPDRGKPIVFYLIPLVAGVLLISGGMLIP